MTESRQSKRNLGAEMTESHQSKGYLAAEMTGYRQPQKLYLGVEMT